METNKVVLDEMIDQIRSWSCVVCFRPLSRLDMAAHTEHPIIFPLSNPTHLMEAKASDLVPRQVQDPLW